MSRPVPVPESLRYRDGRYRPERMARADITSPRTRRIAASLLRAVHRPWFAVWMPTGVAALTTTGRTTGKPRTTFVRAYRDDDRAYLVSIAGEHAQWLKNVRADPHVTLRFRHGTLSGVARDPRHDSERRAVDDAFCGRTLPFDYPENMFHRRGLPTRTKIIELHRAWLEGGVPLIVEAQGASRTSTLPRTSPDSRSSSACGA